MVPAVLRRHLRTAALALLVGVGAAGAVPQGDVGTRGLEPAIEPARGGQCVADPAFMRRNHGKLLKHQRDDTVHLGLRTGPYSLKACIGCHASRTTDSVAAARTDFCQSCHAYAAVQIDCFECHASKPQTLGSAQP